MGAIWPDDMVWYGSIWLDMVRYEVTLLDMVWYGAIWLDMKRYGYIWCDIVQYVLIWCDMARCEAIWSDIAGNGVIWLDMAWYGARSKELAKYISLSATISSVLTIFIGREKFMSSCPPTILDFLRHLALAESFWWLKNINIKIHCNHCRESDNLIKCKNRKWKD